MEDNNNGQGRQMHQGDWKCSGCNTDIKELPFKPAEDRTDQLKCLDCYRKSAGGGERKMRQGSWKCSGCNGDITELPFDPDPSKLDQLVCRDCYKKKKGF